MCVENGTKIENYKYRFMAEAKPTYEFPYTHNILREKSYERTMATRMFKEKASAIEFFKIRKKLAKDYMNVLMNGESMQSIKNQTHFHCTNSPVFKTIKELVTHSESLSEGSSDY